nr:beta-glucuronosyltransferase GlcAT14B [Ipomoea batatas]
MVFGFGGGGFIAKGEVMSSFITELLRPEDGEGLILFKDMGLDRIVVDTDLEEVVHAIKGESDSWSEPETTTTSLMFLAKATNQVGSKLKPILVFALPPPSHIAYLISGSVDDGDMLRRTLQALYHPNNQYVAHLDAESSPQERLDHATTCRRTLLSLDSTMSG